MKAAIVLATLALAVGATTQSAEAAHAGAPYKNVDHRNDSGNDTGDAQVDQLNAAQSDANYYKNHPAPQPGAVIVPAR